MFFMYEISTNLYDSDDDDDDFCKSTKKQAFYLRMCKDTFGIAMLAFLQTKHISVWQDMMW